MYLAKYVAKAEPSFDLQLPSDVSDPERYLRSRIVGRLEVDNTLLGFHLCQGSRTIIFLPTEFHPQYGILKRKAHLPSDDQSTDIFYDTLYDKYLDRSHNLKQISYPDYVRYYRFLNANKNHSNVTGNLCDVASTDDEENDDSDGDDDDGGGGDGSDDEISIHPCSTDSTIQKPQRKRQRNAQKSQTSHIKNNKKSIHTKDGRSIVVDTKGRTLLRRKVGKEAIPRWRFYKPNGDDQEKYYEQKLILNIPFTRRDIADQNVLSPENRTKTYMEECVLRGLFDVERDALDTLKKGLHRGYSLERLQHLAQSFVETNMISHEDSDMFMKDAKMVRPDEGMEVQGQVTEDSEVHDSEKLGDLHVSETKLDLESVVKSLTNSQKSIFDYVDKKLSEKQQFLLCVVGEAGTGKSYLIKAIAELIKRNHASTVVNLATTGVAAHLIGGTTVHSFLKMNIECESFLERGTPEFTLVRGIENIIIDEFSMLELKVFIAMDKVTRRVSPGPKRRLPFRGKNLLLIGDPAQLPAIGYDIYESFLFHRFDFALLKEIKRQESGVFTDVLQKIRFGICDEEVKEVLSSRVIPVESHDDISVGNGAIIVSKRSERDFWNQKFLQSLLGETYEFEAEDTDSENRELSKVEKEKIKRFHRERLPDKLQLKLGARVVLLRNLDIKEGWVNGTIAKVICINQNFVIIQRLDSNKKLIVQKYRQSVASRFSTAAIIRSQFPLILGWALTVHKVQGMTLEKAFVLMNESFFASGQAYVALSRVRKIENLYLLHFDPRVIFLSDRQKELLNWLISVDSTPSNERKIPKLPEQKKLNLSVIETDYAEETVVLNTNSLPQPEHQTTCVTLSNSQEYHSLVEYLIFNQSLTIANAERIVIEYRLFFENLLVELRSIEPVIFDSSKNTVDHSAKRLLHPVLARCLLPVITPSDGNCMWHSISKALVQSTEYMECLRMITVATMLQNKEYFQLILNGQSFASTTFEEAVTDALTLTNWGK